MIESINDKLKSGMIFKNYKELCDYLEEPIVRGNSLIKQKAKFKRYFNYEKIGYKLKITEVYDEPMDKIDLRSSGNRSVYIKYIETILLHILSNCTDQTLLTTRGNLMISLGITGRKYVDKIYKKQLLKQEKYTQEDMNEFNERTYNFLTKLLERSLNNLKQRCLIDWNKELHIQVYDDYLEKSVVRIATDEERRIYTEAQLNILRKFGEDVNNIHKYDSIRDIYLNHINDKYYKELNKYLFDNYEWESSYIFYKIIFTKESVVEAIDRTERQLEYAIEKNKYELNSKVLEALNKSIETHFVNNQNKFNDAVKNYKWINIPQYKLNDDYISKQQKLTNELVKR